MLSLYPLWAVRLCSYMHSRTIRPIVEKSNTLRQWWWITMIDVSTQSDLVGMESLTSSQKQMGIASFAHLLSLFQNLLTPWFTLGADWVGDT